MSVQAASRPARRQKPPIPVESVRPLGEDGNDRLYRVPSRTKEGETYVVRIDVTTGQMRCPCRWGIEVTEDARFGRYRKPCSHAVAAQARLWADKGGTRVEATA